MKNFFLSTTADSSGMHLVHHYGCNELPKDHHEIGHHFSCHAAIMQARKIFENVNGCPHCISECHISEPRELYERVL